MSSAFFGPVTVTVQDDGSLVVDAPAVPGGVVAKMHEMLSPTATGFAGNYTLTFANSTSTATGTIALTKS